MRRHNYSPNCHCQDNILRREEARQHMVSAVLTWVNPCNLKKKNKLLATPLTLFNILDSNIDTNARVVGSFSSTVSLWALYHLHLESNASWCSSQASHSQSFHPPSQSERDTNKTDKKTLHNRVRKGAPQQDRITQFNYECKPLCIALRYSFRNEFWKRSLNLNSQMVQ